MKTDRDLYQEVFLYYVTHRDPSKRKSEFEAHQIARRVVQRELDAGRVKRHVDDQDRWMADSRAGGNCLNLGCPFKPEERCPVCGYHLCRGHFTIHRESCRAKGEQSG